MFRSIIAAHPADVSDEGIPRALDVLRGTMGADVLSLVAAAAPSRRFRARMPTRCFVQSAGGLNFTADERLYSETRIKPARTPRRSADLIWKIADACRARSMAVHACVSTSRTGRIAAHHPGAACKNVFGDASRAGICLNDEDVRVWLRAVVCDLGAREVFDAIELTDFHVTWPEARTVALPLGREALESARFLLGLCLCESCRRAAGAAGVNTEAVVSGVRRRLESAWGPDARSTPDPDRIAESDPALGAFLAWRAEALAGVLTDIARASSCPILLVRSGDADEARTHRMLDASVTGGVVEPRADDGASNPPRGSTSARRFVAVSSSEPARGCVDVPRFVGVSSSDPIMSEPTQLVTMCSDAAESGLAGVRVDDYGGLTPAATEGLRQAFRFARRIGEP